MSDRWRSDNHIVPKKIHAHRCCHHCHVTGVFYNIQQVFHMLMPLVLVFVPCLVSFCCRVMLRNWMSFIHSSVSSFCLMSLPSFFVFLVVGTRLRVPRQLLPGLSTEIQVQLMWPQYLPAFQWCCQKGQDPSAKNFCLRRNTMTSCTNDKHVWKTRNPMCLVCFWCGSRYFKNN